MDVLIVEDDALFARSLRLELEDHGYVCCVAHSLDEAFEYFQRHAPRAVVSDLKLGSASGLVLLEHVMHVSPRTTRLLMSADLSSAAGARPGLLQGKLGKPFPVSSLCGLLENQLGSAG